VDAILTLLSRSSKVGRQDAHDIRATRRLVARYQALGMWRIETRYYTGARHELLNETNRDEVQRDVLAWLAKTV
jgi:alpha-beta hydrolase superfamily lysophospholipase